MNKEELEELIGRYENGNTSLEEEQKLSYYFTEKPFENELVSVQAQFVYFENQKNEAPSEVSEKLHQMLKSDNVYASNVRVVLRIAAMLVVTIGAGWLLSHWYTSEKEISTGPHERTRIALSDGTIVLLNYNSELRYDEKFDDEARVVHLKGEAYFEVQRDSLRPFFIHTGVVTTEVRGTSFNLRSYERERATEINVTSGQVHFGADKKNVVRMGEGMTYFADRKQSEGTSANVNADAWKTGKLTFEDAKMADVIRDIERYFQITVTIKTPSILNCHFTGEFSDPSLSDVMKVIGYSLNIRYTLSNGAYMLSGLSCENQ